MPFFSTFVAVSLLPWTAQALAPYTDPTPSLPDRTPFGFGSAATGGGSPNGNNTYLVDNMPDLRTVLKLDTPRIVYVKGEILGSEINSTTTGDCQYYIDTSNTPEFNFTKYVQSLNETYTDEVKNASAAGREFEGQNATALLELLNHQNGWRPTVQNVQKSWESIDAAGNLTLIGWDSSAYLHGINLVFNTRSNIIMRNLKLSSPRDCFPAPETYPSSWNARYDAVSMVSSHTVWFDGNIFEDGPVAVAPEDFIDGWKVDRFDGLFDAEDGTDNVTFSHNIVANHHKSLLWGGGEKEADRDIGNMKFTVFANHFANSMSRNPLMRFGTFYLVNNLFSNYANSAPLFDDTNTTALQRRANATYTPAFQYNLGIYNMSNVLVSGNFFDQTGAYPNDTTRIFSFSDLATPATPATLCSPPDLSAKYPELANFTTPKSVLNGAAVDLAQNARATFQYHVAEDDDSVAGGMVVDCDGFVAQAMPAVFDSAADVEAYVRENAGQVGQTVP